MTEPNPHNSHAGEPPRRTQPLPVVSNYDAAPRWVEPVGAPISRPGGSRGAGLSRPRVRVGTRWSALLLAIVAAALLWLTCRVFLDSLAGQRLDEAAFRGAEYGQGKLWRLAEPVLDVVSVSFVVLGLIAAMVIALIRLRWGLALQVAALVAGANVTTQVLKHRLLERPDLGVPSEHMHNSLPSGHTTVAASVSVALLMVVPRSLRPVVALAGGAYTAATGVSTLVGKWHRPSDVIAALLVVLLWTALVCVVTPRSSLDKSRQTSAIPTAVAATVLILVMLGAGVVSYLVLNGGHVPLLAPQAADAPDVRAYLGMAFAVVAATAATFAGSLLMRQASARG